MDNIKYFIEMRYILQDLKRVYNRIIEHNNNINMIKGISNQEYEIINNFKYICKNINIDEINKLSLTADKITDHLYNKCNHYWESDTIDINIEQTMQIEYCTICESTKKI